MLSSWAALGTGASEGLTGRSTSGCPGWAYTGLGSEQKDKLTLLMQTDDEHRNLPQTLLRLSNTEDTYVKLRTPMKKTQLFKTTKGITTQTPTHMYTHSRHTVSWAGRSNRKAAECCRLGRNVRLDQLIRFIFTWLQANSARLSRRLDLTFFLVVVLLKRAKMTGSNKFSF